MFLIYFLMILGGICRFLSVSMLRVWIDPQTYVMMVLSRFIAQPYNLISIIGGLYLSCSILMTCHTTPLAPF